MSNLFIDYCSRKTAFAFMLAVRFGSYYRNFPQRANEGSDRAHSGLVGSLKFSCRFTSEGIRLQQSTLIRRVSPLQLRFSRAGLEAVRNPGICSSTPGDGRRFRAAVLAPLRRGFRLYPVAHGPTAGILAGLVGVTVLEMYCPYPDRLHKYPCWRALRLAGSKTRSASGAGYDAVQRNFPASDSEPML
jgi:hypothetical protein